MSWKTYPARERDEAQRRRERIARLQAAIPKASPPKREELEAELRVLLLPPTV